MKRRTFLSLAGATAIAAPWVRKARADNGQVIVAMGSGDWLDANIAAYAEPFQEESGVEVVIVEDWFSINKLRLWNETNSTEWDVVNMGGSDIPLGQARGWLVPIDFSLFNKDELAKIDKSAVHDYGVGALFYSTVLAYWEDQFKDRPAPTNWMEFWDVEKFPGRRTLVAGELGWGSWEIALLADGVPIDQIYPMDIERAFQSLKRIKPHITRWWSDGSDLQQSFADRIIDLGSAYNGRIGNLQKQGLPIVINWNQAKLETDFWGIPKGAPNEANAQKFVEFATRAKQQAIFAEHIPYGPTNLGAYEYLKPELAKTLPSYPDNLKGQFARNYAWEAEVGTDGKSNLERLIERWSQFITE